MPEFQIAEGYVDVHLKDHTDTELQALLARLRATGGASLPVNLDDQTGRDLRDLDARMRTWARTHGQNVEFRGDARNLDASMLAARRSALALADATARVTEAQRVSREVAERLAREELTEAEATRLAAKAARDLERAELAQTVAARAAAQAADHLAAQQRQLARDTALAAAAERLAALRSAGNRREHNALLAETRRRFGDLGRDSNRSFRDMETFGGRAFGLLRRSGTQAMDGISQGLTKLGESAPAMMIGIPVALAALPALAVAAGAGITLGLGAGLAGAAIMAAAKSKEVQRSFAGLKKNVAHEMRDLAKPFEPQLVHIAHLGQQVFDSWKPHLKSAFDAMAPAVGHFADKVALGLDRLGPTFEKVGAEFDPLLRQLGDQMPTILDNIARGLEAAVGAASGHGGDFASFVVNLSKLVLISGQVVGGLADAYEWVSKFANFPDSPWSFIKDAIPPLNLAVGLIHTATSLWNKAFGHEQKADPNAFNTDALVAAAEKFSNAAPTAASAAQKIAGDLKKAGDASKGAAAQVDALTASLNRLFNPALAVYKDTTAMKQGFIDLVKALKGSHGALGLQSAKSRAARDAFAAQLDITSKLATSTLNSTHSMGKARAAVAPMIESLYKLAGSNKTARAMVDKLAQALGVVPRSVTTKLKGEIGDLQAKIEAAKAKLRTVPPSRQAAIRATIAQLQAQVARAQARLNSLHDKDVTVRMKQLWSSSGAYIGGRGGGAGRADGGIDFHRYAGGGVRHDVPPHITNTPTVLFGEPETGGEAFIPLGAGKRRRSTGLLAEVAAMFGLVLTRRMEDGGLLDDGGDDWTDEVEAYANGGLRRRARPRGPSQATLHKRAVAAAKSKAKKAEIKHDAGAKLIAGITSAMLSSLSKIQSFATSVNDKIRSTFSGKTESRLLAWAKSIETRMAGAAKQSQAIADKIKEAKDYAATTKGSMLGTATLSSIGPIGNAADIKSGLGYRLDSLKAFSAKLSKLVKAGLNKTMLQQIIDAGPEQGSVLADMFLKDLGSIKSVNATQKELDKISGVIGDNAADAMYDSGKNASKGFLTGLYGQQAELNKLMEKLGAQLAKGLAKAFGVKGAAAKAPISKSGKKPGKSKMKRASIKPHAAGGIARAGELATFGEEGPELVRVGSTSRVFTAQETARMTGGVTINGGITVKVEGTFDFSDPKAAERLAEQAAAAIQKKIRKLERGQR